MTNGSAEPTLVVPPARDGHRRSFSESDKRRIVEESGQPGASLSEVARRYGIAARVLFRWKQELKPSAAPMFVTVQIADASAPSDFLIATAKLNDVEPLYLPEGHPAANEAR